MNNIDPTGLYYYDWDTGEYKTDAGQVVTWNEVYSNNFTEQSAKGPVYDATWSNSSTTNSGTQSDAHAAYDPNVAYPTVGDGLDILTELALGEAAVKLVWSGTSAIFKALKAWRAAAVAANTGTQGFKSFAAFKKAMGAAGDGLSWHHIVEQNPANIAKFGAEAIHNTDNLIKLPNGAGSIHAQISGYYSSKQFFTGGKTVREWLSTQSYEYQYNFGIQKLKEFGWKAP